MKFNNLVLEEADKNKILSYSKDLRIKEFFYSKKIKNEYLSVFYLVNIQFWKSKTFPFFAFIFPIFFIGILGKMLGYESMFSNVISISSTTIGLIALPTSILEFKNSILLKRIGVTKVSPFHFIMIVFIFYFFIMFVGTVFTVIISISLFHKHWEGTKLIEGVFLGREKQALNFNIPALFQNGINIRNGIFAPTFSDFFKNANWYGVFYGYFLNCILSLVIGVVIASFSKSLMALQALAVPVLIISNFLSGQVLPLNLIISNSDLWNISYITPFKYTNNIIIESFNGNPKESDISNFYLDLTSFQTTLTGNDFKTKLSTFDSTTFSTENFTKIIDSLKQGTYNGSTDSTSVTKYEWLGDGAKIIKIQEPISIYIKNFLLNFAKASKKHSSSIISVALNFLSNFVSSTMSYFGIAARKEEAKLVEIDVVAPIINSYKIVGLERSNPFDIFKSYKSLNLTHDSIITIIGKTEKILNNSLIYLWIVGLLLLGVNKFRWSSR